MLRTVEADELRIRSLELELTELRDTRDVLEEREECLDAGLHAEAKEVEIQQEELLQVPVQDEHSELRLRMELEEQVSEQVSF